MLGLHQKGKDCLPRIDSAWSFLFEIIKWSSPIHFSIYQNNQPNQLGKQKLSFLLNKPINFFEA